MSVLNEQTTFSIAYHEQLMTLKLTNFLRSIVPSHHPSYVIACIGTDRSTGDSLGPLTGSLLQQKRLQKLHVYGTLHEPLHALNLQDYLHEINETYENPFIIAVDAALGSTTSIGTIYAGCGPLQPGSALNKDLPAIGHAHLSATVNINSEMNYIVLQNTRLSIVYDLAASLARVLYRLDLSLRDQPSHHLKMH